MRGSGESETARTGQAALVLVQAPIAVARPQPPEAA
jgi:hypothetical protein